MFSAIRRPLCGLGIIATLVSCPSPAATTATAATTQAQGQKPQRVWFAPNTEIHSPGFSFDGNSVVFSRKQHEPDGAEAETFTDKQLDVIFHRKDKNPRWADPQIVTLSLGDKTLRTIDWGWSGAFSPDGRTIYYDYQKKPISGSRALAGPLSGNDIRAFDLTADKQTTLATPTSGYFSDPAISADGKHLAYQINDATNGDWGGGIGVGVFSLADGKDATVIAPAKHHNLYDLIGTPIWCGNALVARRKTPASGGTYTADKYDIDVINDSMTSLATVEQKGDDMLVVNVWSGGDGKLLVHEQQSGRLREVDVASGKVLSEKVVKIADGAVLNPNGSMVASGKKSAVVLTDMQTHKTRSVPVRGSIGEMQWSRDGKKLAFVATIYQNGEDDSPFIQDELWVLVP